MITPSWRHEEGSLEKTPLAHILVYIHTARLSGALLVEAPDGAWATIVFLAGFVAKAAVSTRSVNPAPDGEEVDRRLVDALAMVGTSTFTFDEGLDPLPDGTSLLVDPFPALWRGIRQHPSEPHKTSVLARIGDRALCVTASAEVERFRFDADESAAVERLRARPMSVSQLALLEMLEADVATSLAYLLFITKQVDAVRAHAQAASAHGAA
jgi:hypothetical protein